MTKQCPDCKLMFKGNKCGCGYKIINSPVVNFQDCATCKGIGSISAYQEIGKNNRLWARFRCLCPIGSSLSEWQYSGGESKRWLQWSIFEEAKGWVLHRH